jgi:hypothetical protein
MREQQMTHAMRAICCTALLVAVTSAAVRAADVQVGINIGVPLPPVLVVQPPLVVVPTTPAVSYAPEAPYDVFFYGGQYYAWQNNGWFVTPRVGQPWVYVERSRVPRPLLVVPARYYKVPPGHLHGHGRGHGKHWDNDD